METDRLKDRPSYFHFLQVRLSLLLSQTSSILQHLFKLTVSDMIFRNMQPFFGTTLLDNNEGKCEGLLPPADSQHTAVYVIGKGRGFPRIVDPNSVVFLIALILIGSIRRRR